MRFMRALLLLAMPLPALAVAQPGWVEQVEAWVQPPWAERLEARLALLEAGFDGELGVHVRDLETGARLGSQ